MAAFHHPLLKFNLGHYQAVIQLFHAVIQTVYCGGGKEVTPAPGQWTKGRDHLFAGSNEFRRLERVSAFPRFAEGRLRVLDDGD
jgi:hypothetical protein